jgi:hypothetical protein
MTMPKRKNSPDYGKGDWKRPVDEKKYSENWDRIFGSSKQQKGRTNETGTNSASTE